MNIFWYIFYIDAWLLAILYIWGEIAVKMEFKDTWKDEKTMEVKKSRRLSKAWLKVHPILDFLQNCHYEIGWKLKIPEEIYDEIKWFIQRGKRGYSDRDVWGFHYYLADVIFNGIKDFKKQVHGVPCDIPKKIGEKHSSKLRKSIKEWKRILGEIQWTFKTVKKIDNGNWILVENEKQRKRIKSLKFRKKYHIMTKEECKRYNEGWKLFKKYFYNLWD